MSGRRTAAAAGPGPTRGAVSSRTSSGAAERAEAAYDEAFRPEGGPRPGYRELLAQLEAGEVGELGRGLKRRLLERGVTFGAADDGIFALDPVPRVLTAAEWEPVAAGIAQRVRALESLARDAYGERHAVEAGVLPARVLHGAPHLEPAMVEADVRRWIALAGFDLVRGPDGRFQVLEDQVRMPSGLAYAVAAREELAALLPQPAGLRPVSHAFRLLATALRDAAPDGVDDPNVVLLAEGPGAAAWYEHERLGRELDVPVVTLDDLERRRGRLVVRRDHELLPVDVVYQRTEQDRFSDEHGRLTALGEALLEPCRTGRLACVNAPGSGLCDDKVVHSYVPELIRFYLGEEPLLDSVRSYDLAAARAREEALGRLDELVIKPRGEMGGADVVIWSDADERLRRRTLERLRSEPERVVAQERVLLSTHPTLWRGRLEPRHVDLRPYALVAGDGPEVLPGGLTRVALEPGSLIVNSGQGGGVKDTWVLG
jgi:uncharacterized circularly permuted ATP-grasp superfamily protein